MTALRLYRYGSHTIGTRQELPELPAVSAGTPTLLFERRRTLPTRKTNRVHEWRTTDGRVLASLHRTSGSFAIHFKRLARFQVSTDLAHVRGAPCASLPPASMRHLFLDQVLPLCLALSGDFVLHASAVEFRGRAVAFVGESGAGKSTLAAALGRADGRILADDCVVIDRRGDEYHVSAPYRSLRLWEDSAAALNLRHGQPGHRSGKRGFSKSTEVSFASGPSPLGAVCLLNRTRSVDRAFLSRLPAAEAVVMLVRSLFRFDVGDRRTLEREFRFLSPLVMSVPCYRLTLPESLAEVGTLRQVVLDAAGGNRSQRIA